MTGYTVALSCPRCAQPLTHEDDGGHTAFESWVTAGCVPCARSWLVNVALTPIEGRR